MVLTSRGSNKKFLSQNLKIFLSFLKHFISLEYGYAFESIA